MLPQKQPAEKSIFVKVGWTIGYAGILGEIRFRDL
jgi:hypothetical protein